MTAGPPQPRLKSHLRFVLDVLDMWSFIEKAMAKFSATEKQRIEKEAEPFGSHVQFPGFNGNIESEYLSIARFLMEDMARFTIFKGRDLNSRALTAQTYRGMLDLFLPMRTTLAGRHLSADEVIALLRERIHSDLR